MPDRGPTRHSAVSTRRNECRRLSTTAGILDVLTPVTVMRERPQAFPSEHLAFLILVKLRGLFRGILT